MTYIIDVNNLKASLEKEDVVLIDVRSNLQNPDEGFLAYKENHLPGAFYLHLKKDLSGEVQEHGGNHPLPNIDDLALKLSEIGIDHETKVVIYDEKNDMYAARAWWLLHYMGHEHVFVLDGGYAAWENAGYEVTNDLPKREPRKFIPRLRTNIVAHIDHVKQRNQEKSVLIDSRAKDRYLGKTEPLYSRAGHIPGAKNYFWQDVLNKEGRWKEQGELRKHFDDVQRAEEIIVSCGSGISACPNFIALKMAGYSNVKLYPGSFSDWISYKENPVEKGK